MCTDYKEYRLHRKDLAVTTQQQQQNSNDKQPNNNEYLEWGIL